MVQSPAPNPLMDSPLPHGARHRGGRTAAGAEEPEDPVRWQLLQAIDEVVPGRRVRARAATDFPDELFADHFPSFPVTPGVLLVELGAQAGGVLVQATVHQEQGHWVFPVLTVIREAKFRAFVPPRAELTVTAELEALRPGGALVGATLERDGRRCASMRVLLAFDPDGKPAGGDAAVLAARCRDELARLGSPWCPPEAA
jgi:3-hydroxyacyl-[acyl-carrier-protein] dehydratase